MRKKTVLAIAFASGLLSSALPAISETTSKSTDPLIQQIADSTKLTPEMRAYCLLLLASSCLDGSDRATVDPQFAAVAAGTATLQSFFSPRNKLRDYNLVAFADKVSQDHSTIQPTKKLGAEKDPLSISDQNVDLADAAIKRALSQLDQVSDKFTVWNMYFIASRLFQKMDNIQGTQKCNKFLEEAFQSCELSSPVSEGQVKAAVSILNTMATGLIAVPIPDRKTEYESSLPGAQVIAFTENNFLASEKLKLRAAAISDRLPATDHLRRKTHRDLVLWYAKLGKDHLSFKQKEILFRLVGINDDRILYPYAEGCALAVWWVTERTGTTTIDCGRG